MLVGMGVVASPDQSRLGKPLGKWNGRSLANARKLLVDLVAGGGFEPPTFGL
jgi:hypothetical protein